MQPADIWPTPRQEHLLHAALDDGESVQRAWDEWRRTGVMSHADDGSQRLAPLVFHNLRRNGIDLFDSEGLKASYLKTRAANKLRLARLEALLIVLSEGGIPALLLKGAGLTLAVYRDTGLRPMADLDIAVQPAQLGAALAVLTAAGWASRTPRIEKSLADPTATVILQSGDGAELDVHRSPFHQQWRFVGDRSSWAKLEPLWETAIPVRVGKASALCLSPCDNLLHALEHGSIANVVPPIRWIADALWILRGVAPIDWPLFVARAQGFELSTLAFRMLRFLNRQYAGAVPPWVLDALRRQGTSREMFELALRRGRWRRLRALRLLVLHHARRHRSSVR